MSDALRIVAAPGADDFAARLAAHLGAPQARLEHRRFPDGESYLRLLDDVAGCAVGVVAQLRDPDPQLPALLFLADLLRDLGAARITLAAPYLPYLRQDARFRPGEALSARSFARLLGRAFDAVVSVDPHLHRIASLGEVFDISATVVASAPAVAAWLRAHVPDPFLIGPDEESAQWVGDVAARAGCPHAVLVKERRGDRDVVQTLPAALDAARGRTPVLLDDIVSSAHTLAGAARLVAERVGARPLAIAVHAVFAPGAEALLAAHTARVVSCNTLPHPSNAIDVSGAVAAALASP